MNISWWGIIIGVGVSIVLAWSGMNRPIKLGLTGANSFTREDLLLQDAHKHCLKNRGEIEKSTLSACFYCENIFPPAEIQEWVDDGQTAICPHCGIDAVLGNWSGFGLTKEFLHNMNERWFA